MQPSTNVLLEFHPQHVDLAPGKDLRAGLSAALCMGHSLWLANDESVTIERLTLHQQDSQGKHLLAREHKQFALHDFLPMPLPAASGGKLNEADIEGMACDGTYLWLAGSHSLRRKRPKEGNSAEKAYKRLASVHADGNRYLLARIPVVAQGDGYTLARAARGQDRLHSAAILRGDAHGNELTALLRQDEHLGPFLALPGKDNGVDIEGVAAAGKHLLLGLRGPVLRGWAVIIEVCLVEDAQPATLRLGPVGENGELYRKHFLDLRGLGIRDLCVQGKDLLILAGPTMALDGPAVLYRWPDGTGLGAGCIVPAAQLEHMLELPFGQGADRPEGITLLPTHGGAAPGLLGVHDCASPRRQVGASSLVADVFSLPEPNKPVA